MRQRGFYLNCKSHELRGRFSLFTVSCWFTGYLLPYSRKLLRRFPEAGEEARHKCRWCWKVLFIYRLCQRWINSDRTNIVEEITVVLRIGSCIFYVCIHMQMCFIRMKPAHTVGKKVTTPLILPLFAHDSCCIDVIGFHYHSFKKVGFDDKMHCHFHWISLFCSNFA